MASVRAGARWAALSCLAASGALAQPALPAGRPLDAVVVTATRTPVPLSRVLADVSVLEREAIERSGATCVADLLARLPGVSFGRSGGPGGITGVFIRGAESRHTAVYIDGVRVDAQGTGGAPWELLPVDNIERVEVLRGPAAAVYGSDAVGGVVQLFTRRGERKAQASAALTLGSQDSAQLRAALSGQLGGASPGQPASASAGQAGAMATAVAGPVDYALSASHSRSRAFNARPVPSQNPDRDGWQRSGLQARAGLALAPGQRLEAALLASNLRSLYDGSLADDDVSQQQLRSASLAWQADWSAAAQTRLQLGRSTATYESQPSFYRTETTLRSAVLQQVMALGAHQLSATLEHRDDQLHNPATAFAGTLQRSRHDLGLALGWRLDVADHAFQLHGRLDRDSQFGSHPTGSAAWGWQFAPAWRVSAALATSFRAPTLYQHFSEYGVADLQPEQGRNLELALRWREGTQELSATLFRNRLRQLISFGAAGPCASGFGCYENVGRAQYEGITLAGRGQLGALALMGSLDYHDPRNLDSDRLLVRRARMLATFSADLLWGEWGLGLELQAAGKRYDNAANTRLMGGYGLVNLRADRALSPDVVLQARLDNAGGKGYELAQGYASAGRTASLGLRWALR